MFNNSKYTKWYFSIIENAKLKNNKTGYMERHHIIPKSFGGNNTKNNLVCLTAKEHFVCHLLLTKMTNGENRYKMLHAFMLMKGQNDQQQRYINSKMFQLIKKEFGEMIRNKKIGTKQTQETKNKIRNAIKGKPSPISEAGRKSISEKAKARIQKPKSEEYKKNMSEAMKLSHAKRGHKSTSAKVALVGTPGFEPEPYQL